MHKAIKSLGHAVSGLTHAVKHERNLRNFLLGQAAVIVLGIVLGLSAPEWMVLVVFGAGFVTIELLNTSLERLADTIDDCQKVARGGHYHPGIKHTKDVGSAAALVAFGVYVLILLIVFLPRIAAVFGTV